MSHGKQGTSRRSARKLSGAAGRCHVPQPAATESSSDGALSGPEAQIQAYSEFLQTGESRVLKPIVVDLTPPPSKRRRGRPPVDETWSLREMAALHAADPHLSRYAAAVSRAISAKERGCIEGRLFVPAKESLIRRWTLAKFARVLDSLEREARAWCEREVPLCWFAWQPDDLVECPRRISGDATGSGRRWIAFKYKRY